MADTNIIVEKVWPYPLENYIPFLAKCSLYVQVRNKSGHPVRIEKVECHFEMEKGVEAYVPSRTYYETLQHGHLSNPIAVEIEADLALKAHTNFYRIVISYYDGKKKTFEYDPQRFLVFCPLGQEVKQFFISHKDRQDTERAQCLAGFLSKLGFIGYISEDDHRPGMDLWSEKIPQAISGSIGVIILWTSRAAKNPKNIYREITIAKSKRKRLILAREKGVRIPRAFPKKKFEYHPFERPLSITQLKKLACHIYETDRHGGYS